MFFLSMNSNLKCKNGNGVRFNDVLKNLTYYYNQYQVSDKPHTDLLTFKTKASIST